MIEDLRTAPLRQSPQYDVCILGGGPAGITLALELSGRPDLRICIVESGSFEFELETQAMANGDSVGHPFSLLQDCARGLGGGTQLWSGRCCRLDEIDFRDRSWIRRSGWPISAEDLEPYYARAQQLCGFEAPWTTDGEALQYLKRQAPDFDRALLTPFVWRFPTARDHPNLNFGRRYRKTLDQLRNVTVLLNANVVQLDSAPGQPTVNAVQVKSLNGMTREISARVFVLGCGGVENARLLLSSEIGRPGSVANKFDQVGRHYQQHVRGKIGAIDAAEGLGHNLRKLFSISPHRQGMRYELGTTLSPVAQEREQLLNCSAFMIYEPHPESAEFAAKRAYREWREQGLSGQVRQDLMLAFRRAAGARKAADGKRTAVRLGVIIDLEQEPDSESRVTLSDRKDAIGSPMPRVDWRVGAAEMRTARRVADVVGSEFARLGLGTFRPADWIAANGSSVPKELGSTCHHISTTRMTRDPRTGVVDADCRVYGATNLYAAGSSVFPTGGHANPTLTIVALASRLAEHLGEVLLARASDHGVHPSAVRTGPSPHASHVPTE